MAANLISSLLSRSISASPGFTSFLLSGGEIATRVRSIYSHSISTAALAEQPIIPPIEVKDTQHLINGQFVDAAPGKTFPAYDPRTGDMIADVAEAEAEDIDRAVAAARKAFNEGLWPKMTPYERSRILLQFADLVDKHTEQLAALESWNTGKPYEQSATIEIPMLSRLFRYYTGWADKIHGLTVPADGNYHVQTLHQPIGVAGQMIPWNFPQYSSKTSRIDTFDCPFAGKLFHEAGLPPGVLTVMPGYGPTAGAALASHMDIDKVSSTGSTETGKIVYELAARSNLKPVTLELGGKSPFIVFDDADIDETVQVSYFVHESIYDEFVEKAKARALRRVVGDPFRQGVEQGPQIDSDQFEKILRYIRSCVGSNATLECGGERLGSKGYFIQPTSFSNFRDDRLIAQDEIFGPVQNILKFKDLDEVIKRANTTQYGLASGVNHQEH